jgi:hypothetical protein
MIAPLYRRRLSGLILAIALGSLPSCGSKEKLEETAAARAPAAVDAAQAADGAGALAPSTSSPPVAPKPRPTQPPAPVITTRPSERVPMPDFPDPVGSNADRGQNSAPAVVTRSDGRLPVPDFPDPEFNAAANTAVSGAKGGPPAAKTGSSGKGVVAWTGQLPRNGEISIDGPRVSTGRLDGALPLQPISIQLEPDEFTIVEVPSPSNKWSRLVFRSRNKSYTSVSIHWVILR